MWRVRREGDDGSVNEILTRATVVEEGAGKVLSKVCTKIYLSFYQYILYSYFERRREKSSTQQWTCVIRCWKYLHVSWTLFVKIYIICCAIHMKSQIFCEVIDGERGELLVVWKFFKTGIVFLHLELSYLLSSYPYVSITQFIYCLHGGKNSATAFWTNSEYGGW